MAKIISLTVATPGHLFPFVPIATALKNAGHAPTIVLAGRSEARGEIAGVPLIELPRPALSRGDIDGASLQDRAFALEGEPTARIVDAVVEAEKPDFLLVDPMMWGAMIAAEAGGLAWAAVSHNPMTIRPLKLDVRGPGIPPPRGIVDRIRYRITAVALREANGKYLPPINELRRSRGVPPWKHPWDMFQAPPLTIATTAPPFEYPRSDWSPSVHFVGPLSWEPPSVEPGWLGGLDSRPVVLLAGSSIPEVGPARGWVQLAIDALADEPYQVLATLPTDEIPEVLPSNVRVERFIPHQHILPRASCVVCHGGPGVTQKALSAGVPVVAVPFVYDRFEVAQRVAYAEAGVMIPGAHLTRETLKEAVRTAIGRRAGAERIAAAFAEAGGANSAAGAIQRLLNQREAANVPRADAV